MPTTWNGDASFIGEGLWSTVPASLRLLAFSFSFSGSSTLSVYAFKPTRHLIAHFSGAGAMNVVTIAPRLMASASFIANGRFIERFDETATVLSTQLTNRMSYPTLPSPTDPFMRRPSKDYSNHAGSVRFTGSGRITAIAS